MTGHDPGRTARRAGRTGRGTGRAPSRGRRPGRRRQDHARRRTRRAAAGRREAIRTGIDGFHRPRAVRLRRGSLSPAGCYHDTFDYPAVRRAVLDPLGPGGDRHYRPAVFDHATDRPVGGPPCVAPDGAVLVFDGVFLLRPELRDQWDLSIFLDVTEDETLRRALVRDAEPMGGPDAVRERYRRRYLPAQRLYRADAHPERTADVLIRNDRPDAPVVLRWPG